MRNLKFLFVMMLAITSLLTGCGSKKEETESTTIPTTTTQTPESTEPTSSEKESESTISPPNDDPLAGLTKDQYDGLEITAAVLDNDAIQPGNSFSVGITIKNIGDKTVIYTLGSGSFKTPQALLIDIDGLQPLLPQDYFGPVTMDLQNKELHPGEELSYIMKILAIKPHDEFDAFSYELYNESERFMEELSWKELQERYPELVAAAPGSYEGHVYFTYYLLDENGQADPLGGATGYAQGDFTVSITE